MQSFVFWGGGLVKEQPSSKVKCERNISNITAGLALENEVTFPAQLFASYVLGGWSRTANNIFTKINGTFSI